MDGSDTSCWCSNMTPSSSENLKSPQSRGRSNGLMQKGHFLVLSQLIHHHTFDTYSQKSGFAVIVQSPGWKEQKDCFPWWLMPSSPWHEMHKPDINSEPRVDQMQRKLLPDPTEISGGLPACSFASVVLKPTLCFKKVTREGQLITITSEFHKLAKQCSFNIPQAYPQLLPQVACHSTLQNATKNMFLVKTFHKI